jgi:hypothetical protein
LAKDHTDKEVYDQALDRLRHGEQYKDGAWWVENVETLQRAERRYGKLLPKAERIMIKGKESTVKNINSGHDGGTLGGCGKSALALEFAHRALARHAGRLVFWVPAISQESFELAYQEIRIRLRIPGITDDNADIKQLVKKALSSDTMGDWLMIVDNADNPRVFMGTIDGDPRSARLSDYLRTVIEARSSSRHEVERLPDI